MHSPPRARRKRAGRDAGPQPGWGMGLAEAGPSGRASVAADGGSSSRGGGSGNRSGGAVNPFLYPQVGRLPFWPLSFCNCACKLPLKHLVLDLWLLDGTGQHPTYESCEPYTGSPRFQLPLSAAC